jgi:hypothetical protein
MPKEARRHKDMKRLASVSEVSGFPKPVNAMNQRILYPAFLIGDSLLNRNARRARSAWKVSITAPSATASMSGWMVLTTAVG